MLEQHTQKDLSKNELAHVFTNWGKHIINNDQKIARVRIGRTLNI